MVWRTLIGSYPPTLGSATRIRISKPTKDVLTALSPEDLALDSSWNDAAVVYRTGIVSVPNNQTVVTIPFGETLPTVPFCVVFRVIDTNNFMMGNTYNEGPSSFQWLAECTTTYLRFIGTTRPDTPAIIGGYVILRGPW